MKQTDDSTIQRWETVLWGLLFAAALAINLWGITVGWRNGNLPGCEFRQTQTAISAYFIQKDHDFSPAYPTPVLGKPWSIPMEFPLYQWAVVALSDARRMHLIQAGRAVSALCMYLALPAIYLLLRRVGLPGPRRLIGLSLVLTCPLYIFYSRAFLIETMALMFSLWFLLGFLETLRTRHLGWWLVASIAGAGAGLVKVTTFLLYLLPAAIWGLLVLVRAWRERGATWRPVRQVLVWGLSTTIVPFAATIAWVHYSDKVKVDHPGGGFLTSANMSQFNFGYGAFNLRFSPDAWRSMVRIWHQGILPLPALGAVLLIAGIWGGRWRRPAFLAASLFVGAQFIYPLLYAWHDYYFVANAVLLLAAAAFALAGLLEVNRLRWLGALAVATLLVVQVHTYAKGYCRDQAYFSNGGTGLTNLLADLTGPDEVLVIVGDDWNSMIPFYSQRRALMIRRGRENDFSYIERAFSDLHGELIGGLVLLGEQRHNAALLEQAVRLLKIDPHPVLTYKDTTVYLQLSLLNKIPPEMRSTPYDSVVWLDIPEATRSARPLVNKEFEVDALDERLLRGFAKLQPMPYRFFFTYGFGRLSMGANRVISAHPITKLWIHAPAGARRFRAGVGIVDNAWSDNPNPTDGIEITLSVINPDGSLQLLGSRYLNPKDVPGDRGLQEFSAVLGFKAETDILLQILPGPNNRFDCDWAYIDSTQIE